MAPPPQPTPPYSSPTSQYTQQFLSNVLSQRGPSSLPYSEDVKWLIRQHLLSLTDAFHSIQIKTATFTHNDGRSVNLLQADGTIPITFQSHTYNIPILIWLIESYPRHPPCVYLNPTPDMVIKRPHSHVNPSGLVSLPYLHNWIYPSSNLLDLARNCSLAFGRDPPLYSRQRPTVSSIPRPAIPPKPYPQSPYGGGGGGGRVMEDPNEVYRRNAINRIVEMVHGDIMGMRKGREAEMDGLFSIQSTLRQREEELSMGLREMIGEKESLEQQLQMILMNTDVLEAWLRENEGKKLGNVDVDDAYEACDALSKQMIECTSSDLAIEDVIYSLDKAVQEGVIPFDQYLRNVRLMSREQFFHRAMAAKVRGAQMQAQVSSMAARSSSPYAL